MAKECKATPRCLTCADRDKKMSRMSRGAVLAQYLGRSSRVRGVESEITTAQPREREGSPGPSDTDCQEDEGRCVAHL